MNKSRRGRNSFIDMFGKQTAEREGRPCNFQQHLGVGCATPITTQIAFLRGKSRGVTERRGSEVTIVAKKFMEESVVGKLLDMRMSGQAKHNFGGNVILVMGSVARGQVATFVGKDSTNDLATTFCFLLLHVTKFPPRKVQYLEVDLLSTKDPAYLEMRFSRATSILRKYLSFPSSFISNSRISLCFKSPFSFSSFPIIMMSSTKTKSAVTPSVAGLEVLEVQRTHKSCLPSLKSPPEERIWRRKESYDLLPVSITQEVTQDETFIQRGVPKSAQKSMIQWTSSTLEIGLDKFGPLERVLPIERCNNKAANKRTGVQRLRLPSTWKRERVAAIKAA
ncbi:hypothetical protein CR513_24058, partial [Mucuna pruriens]